MEKNYSQRMKKNIPQLFKNSINQEQNLSLLLKIPFTLYLLKFLQRKFHKYADYNNYTYSYNRNTYHLCVKFINDINTYGSPQGAQYLFLMNNYIQPAVALWSIYEAAPSLGFKITNKAISQKSSEYGQPSSRQDIEYIRQQISNNAQFYSQRIREYITNYPNDFPEYYQITGVNRIKAKRNNYFAGLFLPDTMYFSGANRFRGDERCCDDQGYYIY